jgi:hypothetical protein
VTANIAAPPPDSTDRNFHDTPARLAGQGAKVPRKQPTLIVRVIKMVLSSLLST